MSDSSVFNNLLLLQSLVAVFAINFKEILTFLLIMSLLFLQCILLMTQLAIKLQSVDLIFIRAGFELEWTNAAERTSIVYSF